MLCCEQVSTQDAFRGVDSMMWLPGHPYCLSFFRVGTTTWFCFIVIFVVDYGCQKRSCVHAEVVQKAVCRQADKNLLMWLLGKPCCRRLSASGSLLSGNKLGHFLASLATHTLESRAAYAQGS